MNQLVIHVPHASTFIPTDVIEQFELPEVELHEEARISADLHTDRLAREAWPHAAIVEAEVSRLVLDVERYPDDALECMSNVGRGMIYTRGHNGADLRRKVSCDLREDLKRRFHDPHWQALRSLATGKVLIDLHTYPRHTWSIEPQKDAHRPEIDLGTSDGITPQSWLERLETYFRAAGYEVGCNTPYAGVIDAGASAAIMLEIRRDVLGSPEDKERWEKIRCVLSQMPLP